MTTLVSLPPELLGYILAFVPGTDLRNVCKVCRRLRDVTRVDTLWQIRCQAEYNFTSNAGWDSSTASYFDVYSKVLIKYGCFIGLWQRIVDYYGGLVHIKYDVGRILGIEYLPASYPNVKEPFREKHLFSLELVNGEVKLKCLRGKRGPHGPCDVMHSPSASKDEISLNVCEEINEPTTGVIIKCCVSEGVNQNKHDWDFNEWIETEFEDRQNGFLAMVAHCQMTKFRILRYLDFVYWLRPLEVPDSTGSWSPIQPGLYKGQYSAHGIEIVCIKYNEDMSHIIGTKVTGDPNIPADKVTIDVDLRRPMVLTADQLGSMQMLREIDTPDISPDINILELPEQPFLVPHDCVDRSENDVPNTCRSRFHGCSQIAGHGYKEPKFTPGHMVVFNEYTFGFLWLELNSFGLYSKERRF